MTCAIGACGTCGMVSAVATAVAAVVYGGVDRVRDGAGYSYSITTLTL